MYYKGCLLIATPDMEGSIFDRSVILMCEHDENGAMGLIINKESNISVKELAEMFPLIAKQKNVSAKIDEGQKPCSAQASSNPEPLSHSSQNHLFEFQKLDQLIWFLKKTHPAHVCKLKPRVHH